MRKILFASGNTGKFNEAAEIAAQYGIKLLSPRELAERRGLGNIPEPAEDAPDYAGNAKIKAEAFYGWSGIPSLADDAGLEVRALGGGPGVLTARYAGENTSAAGKIEKLLDEMRGAPDRRACFRCFLFLRIDEQRFATAEAELRGSIAESVSGRGGFGYDPVFIVDGRTETLSALKERGAEVPTHRVLALQKLFAEVKF